MTIKLFLSFPPFGIWPGAGAPAPFARQLHGVMPPTYHRSAGFSNHKMPEPYARGAGRARRVSGAPSTPSRKNGLSAPASWGRPKSGGDSLDLVALSSHSLGPASARSGDHNSVSQHNFVRNAAERPESPSLHDHRRATEAVSSPLSSAPVRLPRSPEMQSARRSVPPNHADFVPGPAGDSPLRISGQPLQVSPSRSLWTIAKGNGTPMIQLTRTRPPDDAPSTSLPLRFDSPASAGCSNAPGISFDQPQSHRRPQPLIMELGDEDESVQEGSLGFQIARRPHGAVASWLRHGPPRAEANMPRRETSLIYGDEECADRGAPRWATTHSLGALYEEQSYEEQEAPLDLYGRPAVISPAPLNRRAPSISPQLGGRWQPAPPLLPVSIDRAPLSSSPPDSPFLARNNSTRKSVQQSAHDHTPLTHLNDDIHRFHAGCAPPGRASVPARFSPQETEAPVTLSDLNQTPVASGEAWPRPDAIRPPGASKRTEGGVRVVSPREEHPAAEPSADAETAPGATCAAELAAPVALSGVDEYGMICSQYGSFIMCAVSPAAVVPSRPSSPHARASPGELIHAATFPSATSDCSDSPLSPISAARRAARHRANERTPAAARAASLGPSAFLFRRFPSKRWRVSRPASAQVALAERSGKPVRRPDWKRYAVLVRGLWLRAHGTAQNGQLSPTAGASQA